ncbi:MAG: hypothetical protein V1944_00880, partial [Candidatus Aenigmatarchaeota archaeon]
ISAMIATVLLIAFTVAIGGVMSIWLTGLTSTQQQQVSNQSTAQTKCIPSLTIDDVNAPVTADKYLNFTFSNPSQQTISSITVLIPNNLTVATVPITSLPPGSAGTAYANVSAAPLYVKVMGICSGIPVSATCENTQACWTTG